jgi:hypothetical protein
MTSTLLDRTMVEARLKRQGPVSWLISRVATRADQEHLIRHWNETGYLPDGTHEMPRLAPASNTAWRRAAL